MLLELRGLTRSFGGLLAVDRVDLDVERGGMVGLIGPNGAGKTTVFNLVTGLYKPDSGSVRLAGRELACAAPHVIAAHGVARTFQNIRLFASLTVLENVLIGCHLRRAESLAQALFSGQRHRLAERQMREHAMDTLEALGLRAVSGELARNLPYGEQRRLEIARALASGPVLLLLDEPASGMNPQETQDLMELLRRIRQERELSMLIIEHDMRFVMGICERLYVLDYGEVIAAGAPADVRVDPKVIEAYLGEAPV